MYGGGWTAALVVGVLEALDAAVGAGGPQMVGEVVAQRAGRVGEAGRERARRRVQQDGGGRQRRGAQQHHLGVVLARFQRLRIDHAHAGGAVGLRIVQYAVHDAVGGNAQAARLQGRRQRRTLRGEIGAERAAARALAARLAWAAALRQVRRGGGVQVGGAAHDHARRRIAGIEFLLERQFHRVEFEGGQEFAVRQHREAFLAAADAGVALDVAVPRRQVGIADRPVGAVAILQVGLEIQVAPAVGLARPHQRLAAQLVPADPAEGPAGRRRIRHVAVVVEELLRVFVEGIALALDRELFFRHARVDLAAVRHGPRIAVFADVADAMLHRPSALDHQRLQAALREFLGGPAAGDAGTDDDGVEALRAALDHECRHRFHYAYPFQIAQVWVALVTFR